MSISRRRRPPALESGSFVEVAAQTGSCCEHVNGMRVWWTFHVQPSVMSLRGTDSPPHRCWLPQAEFDFDTVQYLTVVICSLFTMFISLSTGEKKLLVICVLDSFASFLPTDSCLLILPLELMQMSL